MKFCFVFSFVFFYLCSYVSPLHAQSWVWARTAGGSQASAANDIATDNSGNVYVTGIFYVPSATFGSVTLNSNGMRDMFLAKYDASGNMIWARGAGGTLNDYGQCVATDIAGNIYVAGIFVSATMTIGPFTITNTNGSCSDMFLAKYDASGNVLWVRTAGGTSCETPSKIAVDINGNVYLTGHFWNSSITFGMTTLVNSGMDDLFLVKYNASGNVVWATGSGSPGDDEGGGVTTDASGNIYLTGKFSGTIAFGSYNLVSNGSYDVFITKYNSQGTVLWAKKAGGNYPDNGTGLAVDASGDVYCTGSFTSDTIRFGTINLSNPGFSPEIFLCKYSSAGNVIWAQSGGGVNSDNAYDVAYHSGHVYVAGGFGSPVFTMASTSVTFHAGGFAPFFLAQLDQNGNMECMSSLASGGDICSIDVDPSGNLVACSGYWNSNPAFIIGADSFPNTGIGRVFVAKRSNPIRLITSTPSACITNTGTASASVIGADGVAYAYSWSPVGGNDSIANGLSAGNYTLTVTDPEGCVSSQTIQVVNISTPVVTVSSSGGTNPGDSTQLQASGGVSYIWSPASGLSCDTCSDPIAFPYQTTNYCVTVADTNNCTATACWRVEVADCPVYIPNAFSPNGDSHNDFECIRSQCITALHFSVYDRWGKKVFESFSREFCWDGTYDGSMLEPAVFTYTMEAVMLSGNEIRRSGTISLIK